MTKTHSVFKFLQFLTIFDCFFFRLSEMIAAERDLSTGRPPIGKRQFLIIRNVAGKWLV